MSETVNTVVKRSALMRHREVFGVVIRIVGLFITLYGIYDLVFLATFGFRSDLMRVYPGRYFSFGAVVIVVGVVMIRGEWIVSLAYGRKCED